MVAHLFDKCVICMCESWGLSISQAESCHLDKGFGDSHCLFRTITLIFMPSLRCHSLGSPVTPQETLWNGWEMTDGMSGMNWTKEKVQRGFKNHSCQLAKPSTHISFYWARIQINTDKASGFDVCCCPALRLITHHHSWRVSVYRNINVMVWSSSSWSGMCDGSLTMACLTFSFLTQFCFMIDERAFNYKLLSISTLKIINYNSKNYMLC